MAKKKDVTKPQILDAAQIMLESRGFNGFSTRELADEVGLSSASLHHHFATKGDLAAGVVARLRERINGRLAEIAAEIEGFGLRVRHCDEALQNDAMLLAMTAADFPTLPLVAQTEARQLFANVIGWLTRFATQAKADGELAEEETADGVAARVLSAILGRAMLARVQAPNTLAVPQMTWAWQ